MLDSPYASFQARAWHRLAPDSDAGRNRSPLFYCEFNARRERGWGCESVFRAMQQHNRRSFYANFAPPSPSIQVSPIFITLQEHSNAAATDCQKHFT